MAKIFAGMMLAQMFMRADDGADYGGYVEDVDQKVSPFNFGLNAGVAKLTKFEYIPNGGKDGAEQDALEIIFNINGTDRSYRQFPVTRGFKAQKDGGGEVTDPNAQEFKDAVSQFKQRVSHIAHAFVSDEVLKQALAKKISSFKDYCDTIKKILPKNAPEIPLDIFMQYQYAIRGEAKRTYLDIPSKRSHGAFICKAVTPVGKWTPVLVDNPSDNEQEALKYVDDAGNVHPFKRTGWFMNSNFAKQQKVDGADDNTSSNTEAAANMNAGTTGEPAPTDAPPTVTTW